MASNSKPVFVLIPGLFHRPSSWDAVAEGLRAKGYTVLTPPLAVCGDLEGKTPASPEWKSLAAKDFNDDKQLVLDSLTPLLDEGHVGVIVGHSFGSLPATLAVEGMTVAERKAKGLSGGVAALVFVAGFAYPVKGKGFMGDESEPPLMPYHKLEEGILHLQESAVPIWYSDLDASARSKAWADLHKTAARRSFTAFPAFIASEITDIPKTYIFTEKDEAVVPDFQNMMVQVGGFGDVVKISSGHAPMYSMPERLVEILEGVAAKA